MQDEYIDEEGRISVIFCSTCGESRTTRFPLEGSKIRMFDGKILCNQCRGNQLMERLIALLEPKVEAI